MAKKRSKNKLINRKPRSLTAEEARIISIGSDSDDFASLLDQHWDGTPHPDEHDRMPEPAPSPRKSRSSVEKSKQVSTRLDLHGHNLQEAKTAIDLHIREHRVDGVVQLTVKIITGKGLHSGPEGDVLPREIHRYVSRKYQKEISNLEESPDEVRISGVPIRGHFSITLKFK